MDSLMLRDCIALAMLMPEMPGEAVVAHVTKKTTTAPNTVECEDTNEVRLFAKAS
jgi:hypothetical protein